MNINDQFFFMIILGSFASIILSFSIILITIYSKNKISEKINLLNTIHHENEIKMMQAVFHAQEEEKKNISRNLHDEVGAILSMTQRNLNYLKNYCSENKDAKEELEISIQMINTSIETIRKISHEMSPHFLINFGMVKTLKRMLEQTNKISNIECEFITNITDDVQINEQENIQLYRIILEIFSNTIKHAKPKTIILYLNKINERIEVNIEHDGIAINQDEYNHEKLKSTGLGLHSIYHRLRMIKGDILYSKETIGGRISIQIPLTNYG